MLAEYYAVSGRANVSTISIGNLLPEIWEIQYIWYTTVVAQQWQSMHIPCQSKETSLAELKLLFCAPLKIPRLVKVTQIDTPYFKIIQPPDSHLKVGSGLSIVFTIQFTPEENKVRGHLQSNLRAHAKQGKEILFFFLLCLIYQGLHTWADRHNGTWEICCSDQMYWFTGYFGFSRWN